MTDDDVGRTNRIAQLLAQWGLIEIVEPARFESPMAPMSQIKIIKAQDKDKWVLVPKYQIGRKGSA